MLNISQLELQIRCNIQMLIDESKLDLQVGPIKDEDWDALSSGYSVLNWGALLSKLENDPNKFSITVKLKDKNSLLPAGAFICIYDMSLNVINICCVENFVKEKKEHPLSGKMFFFTMSSVLMFASVTKTEFIYLKDICDEGLISFYEKWGFLVHERSPQLNMMANVSVVVKILQSFRSKKGI